MTCSCGETKPHPVARRFTAYDTEVVLWDDGAVTGRMGFKLPDVPMVRPKTEAAKALALRAGRLLMGEVCLYGIDEVPTLYKACRWAAEHSLLPGDVRARVAKLRRPTLKPIWTVYRTDRDGRPTERVWRLPRLRWPGLVVWDHVNLGSRRGGRYEVFSVDRDDVCTTTGMAFDNLSDLAEYLFSLAQ